MPRDGLPTALWIGDACVPTGFARVNENLIRRMADRWDTAIIGINATGDPHDWPCRVYPAHLGDDPFGYGRLVDVIRRESPDVIVIHSDPWIVARHLAVRDEALKKGTLEHCPPVVAYMPIDAPGTRRANAKALNGAAYSLFYTRFALEEARAAGFTGEGDALPLGIDLDVYRPVDRAAARAAIFPNLPAGAFIVGNVNRNQPRKRLDLSIAYFAKWVKEYDRRDAYLYLHCATRELSGWNIGHLARHYGISDRVLVAQMTPRKGLTEESMREVYSSFDVQITTTLGEGFGLTQLEGMACRVPQIVPEYSALGEWARGAVHYVPVTSYAAHVGYESNCIGGVPDERAFVEALEELHGSALVRERVARAGYERAQSPEFSWNGIAGRFESVLEERLTTEPAEEEAAVA